MLRRWSRLLVIAVTAMLLLPGCGFHLRGSSSATQLASVLPEVMIDGVDIEIGFGRKLQEALTSSGVDVQPLTDTGDVPVLEVGEVKESQRVLSVDRDVRAREYALISRVKFRLLEQPGNDAAWRVVETRRDLVVDPFQVLGSEQEAERMRREMEEDLAQRIVLVLRQH